MVTMLIIMLFAMEVLGMRLHMRMGGGKRVFEKTKIEGGPNDTG